MNKRLFSAILIMFLVLVGWILNDLGIISLPFLSRGSDSKAALGKVAKKIKSVQRRAKDSLAWDDVSEEEKLFAYDSVLTLENSGAFLKMNSGVDLNLDENSLITILPPEDQQDALTLNLKSGSYKVALKSGKQIRVGGVAFKSSEDTALDFKYGADAQTHMSVVAGSVSITGGKKGSRRGPAETAKAGQALTIDSSQNTAKFDEPTVAAVPPTPPVPVTSQEASPAAAFVEPPAPEPVVEQKVAQAPHVKKSTKRKVAEIVPQPPMPIEKDLPATQSAPIDAPETQNMMQKSAIGGTGNQAETVDQRPDPEAVTQDLSELSAEAMAPKPPVEAPAAPVAVADNATVDNAAPPSEAPVEAPIEKAEKADQVEQAPQGQASDDTQKEVATEQSPAAADNAGPVDNAAPSTEVAMGETPAPVDNAAPAVEVPAATQNDMSQLDQPAEMAPAPAPPTAAELDSQTYDAEMAKAGDEPKAVDPKKEANAGEGGWPTKRYTLWAGANYNLMNFNQSGPGSASYSSFGAPHIVLEARPWDKWGFNLFFENAPASLSSAGSTTVTSSSYSWQSYGGEAVYSLTRNLDGQGVGSEFNLTAGIEELSLPFVAAQSATASTLGNTNDLLLTVGAQYNINSSEHLRYEFDGHLKYPLSYGGGSGGTYSASGGFGLDLQAGAIYKITDHWLAGGDLRGEYLTNSFSFNNSTLGSSTSGTQSFMYFSLELKLGYNF